jgi:acyl-CoA synthetase (AMP-forming)/AMP-acid ligase II
MSSNLHFEYTDAILTEERLFVPPGDLVDAANITAYMKSKGFEDYEEFYHWSLAHRFEFWDDFARELHWFEPWHTTFTWTTKPFFQWFVGGKLNIVYNCLDRHMQDELLAGIPEETVVPCEPMESEDPLYILYTSESTGKPKGVVHVHGGYAVGLYATTKFVFDVKATDIFWCTADIGCVTAHSYLIYAMVPSCTELPIFCSRGHLPILRQVAGGASLRSTT